MSNRNATLNQKITELQRLLQQAGIALPTALTTTALIGIADYSKNAQERRESETKFDRTLEQFTGSWAHDGIRCARN